MQETKRERASNTTENRFENREKWAKKQKKESERKRTLVVTHEEKKKEERLREEYTMLNRPFFLGWLGGQTLKTSSAS
jgi:hypothetical protein